MMLLLTSFCDVKTATRTCMPIKRVHDSPVFLWRTVRQVRQDSGRDLAAPRVLNLHGKPQLHAHCATLEEKRHDVI